MEATFFWRRRWRALLLPAFFALALYAQNPAQTIRGGMESRCLRLRRPRRTRSPMLIKARKSRIPTAGSRMRRVRERGPGSASRTNTPSNIYPS